jgi:GNAT superfamily N-acetyltransferase
MQDLLGKFSIVPFDEKLHLGLIAELTDLLHSAYRPLAERGMRYLATHQPPETTLSRLKKGEPYLGFIGDELVATITLIKGSPKESCTWYQKPEVFYFSQFAVKPKYQGCGLGRKLMDFIEKQAELKGAAELALDTSEHADNLISMYQARKYRLVEYTQWEVTNYRSVILSKALTGSGPRQ